VNSHRRSGSKGVRVVEEDVRWAGSRGVSVAEEDACLGALVDPIRARSRSG
jgi:hypothetical protein